MKPDVIIMSFGKVADCFGRQLCSSLTQFPVYLAEGLDLAWLFNFSHLQQLQSFSLCLCLTLYQLYDISFSISRCCFQWVNDDDTRPLHPSSFHPVGSQQRQVASELQLQLLFLLHKLILLLPAWVLSRKIKSRQAARYANDNVAADEGNGNDNDKDNDNKAAPAAPAAVEAQTAAALMMMAIENLFCGYSLQGFSWNFQGVVQQLNYEKRLFENC